RIAELLNRPHGHVVAGIETGERVIAPATGEASIALTGRCGVISRCAVGIEYWGLHRARRVADEAAHRSRVYKFIRARGAETHGRVALAGHHDRRDPIIAFIDAAGVSGGEYCSRLEHGRRGAQVPQFVPAAGVAIPGTAGHAGVDDADVVSGP